MILTMTVVKMRVKRLLRPIQRRYFGRWTSQGFHNTFHHLYRWFRIEQSHKERFIPFTETYKVHFFYFFANLDQSLICRTACQNKDNDHRELTRTRIFQNRQTMTQHLCDSIICPFLTPFLSTPFISLHLFSPSLSSLVRIRHVEGHVVLPRLAEHCVTSHRTGC